MKKYYLAVDIGASSGRHILGHLDNGKIVIEEIHRFHNSMQMIQGELSWDINHLFEEIKIGMKKCSEINKIPVSMGIDTWAVDFVLLDKDNELIGNAVGYRDSRTDGMEEQVFEVISEKQLYSRTGIQRQKFNTIYQLMALKKKKPEVLKTAEKLLMVPDYFNFLLTGKGATEYTNATTTQLINADTKQWDMDIIERLGYPKKIFQELLLPGTILGQLKTDIAKEVGFQCKVTLPATHDTASAIAAVPDRGEDYIYISSGTWSLMGIEMKKANCSEESRKYNFTNEGGYDYRFRFLKNIMGLWMIQSVKKEIGNGMEFQQICEEASKENIDSIVNCNDSRFLSPENMTREVQLACKETGQVIPEGIAQVAAVIYKSLVKSYKDTISEIEEITNENFKAIHILGGGSKADFLNNLTAQATKKKVLAGPIEATAIGNLIVQMIAEQEIKDLKSARSLILESFPIKVYE